MSASAPADPVAARTRAGVKRKKDECRGSHLIHVLNRINRRVETFQNHVERRDPAQIGHSIEVQVARIRVRRAQERVRQLELNIQDIRRELQEMMDRIRVVEEEAAAIGRDVALP